MGTHQNPCDEVVGTSGRTAARLRALQKGHPVDVAPAQDAIELLCLTCGELVAMGADECAACGEPIIEPDEEELEEWAESAQKLLELLVSGDMLELEDGTDVGQLARQMAPLMSREPANAEQVSNWLLSSDAVSDFFLSDEHLQKLLKKW